MISKRIFVLSLMLLLSGSSLAQFQSGRLSDLTSRLAREASEFAEYSYRNYPGSFRGNRNDVEAAMLAHQFSAAAQLFNRMVIDRRRNQELRDGFQVLQELGRAVERNNNQQNRWSSIQRSLSDISREVNYDSPREDYPYPLPGPGSGSSSGSMTWTGRVDDDVRIIVRGGSADLQTIGGTPYANGITNFSAALPTRRGVTVRLNVRRGRGQVFIEQQPSRENDYAAVIRIKDPKGGASDYDFEISW